MATKLVVELELDGSDFSQGLAQAKGRIQGATKASKSFSSSVASIATGFIGAQAVLGAFNKSMGFLKDALVSSIQVASDFQETNAKFETVFKGVSEQGNRMAKELTEGYGLSELAAKKFLAGLQDTFVPMGFAREQAADMSGELVKLAADVGSFNNVATGDVVRDFQSALVGNTETVRKYGIVITETTLKNKALELGIITGNQQLTEQQKSALRLKLIMDGSKDAVGDFARTQDSFANSSKIAANTIEQLQVQVGSALLPVLGKLITIVIPVIKQMAEWAKANQQVFSGALFTAIEVFLAGIKGVISAAGFVAKAFFSLRVVLLAVLETAAKVASGMFQGFSNLGAGIRDVFLTLKAKVIQVLADLAGEAAIVAAAFDEELGEKAFKAFSKLQQAALDTRMEIGKPPDTSPTAEALANLAEGFAIVREEQEANIQKTIELTDTAKSTIDEVTEKLREAKEQQAIDDEEAKEIERERDLEQKELLAEQEQAHQDRLGEIQEVGKNNQLSKIDEIVNATRTQQSTIAKETEKTTKKQITLVGELTKAYNINTEDMQSRWGLAQDTMTKATVRATTQIQGAFGDAAFKAIKEGGNVREVWESLADSILKTLIDALVKIIFQWLILGIVQKTVAGSGARATVQAAVPATFANTMMSMAAAPFPINLTAPAVAGTFASLVQAQQFLPSFQEGTDFVPRTGAAMIHQGERIVDATTNLDLTQFLEEQSRKRRITNEINLNVDNFIGTDEFLDEITEKIGDSLEFRNVPFAE